MKVSLGTVEATDDVRKAVRRAKGGKGLATRGEVKEFLLDRIENAVVPNLLSRPEPTDATPGPIDEGPNYGADLPLTTYQPSGAPGEGLPEPTLRGDTL